MSANLESVVDTVEEEIRRAEALLAHDIMHVGDDWSPSGRQVPAQPRIQESRRREVLDGLRAERDGTANSNSNSNNDNNNGSESSSDSGAERRQQRQREDAAVPPATPSANTLNSSVGMTAPTPGGTERDVLIARLLAEREAKLKNEQFQKQRQQQQQANTPANASSHRGAAGSSNPPATSASVKVTRKGSVVITQQQMPPRAPVAGSAADPYLQHPTMPYFPPPENAAPMARPTDPVPRPAPSLTPSSSATPNLSLSQLHPAAAAEGDAASSYQHGSASSATASASASPAQSPMRWAESTRSKRFSRRTKDDVRREAEEKRKDECTFKPKINSRSRASAKTNTETRRQRFRRLSSTHEAREKHLAAARAKAEAEHMAECTFKPKINKRSSTGDARQAQAGAGVSVSRKQNLPDRLHHEADKRAIARQKMRRHLEKQELESFPFKPSINKRSEEILDMSHYKPIHQRVNDIQRAKHASRLAEKLNRDASNPDLTFRPKINQTSKLLVESRRMDTDDPDQFDVTARLMKDANDASARSLRRQQAYLDEKAAELSFQPKISQASQEIISHNSHYMGPEGSNFLKRQRRLQKKHDKAKARKIREAAEKSECTFKPDTGTASEVLRHTRPYRLKESSLERTERLYRQDIEAKKKKRAALQKRYETECTFRPAINEISRSLAKSKSVQELTDNNRNRQIKHQMAAARERQLQEECTFKPATNVSRRAKKIVENLPVSQFRVNVKQPEKIVKAIDAYRRDREMKLRQTRQEVEYESMKECTFAPDVAGAKVPKQTGPVVVRGLGRYLELKDLAKRLETEKKHREAKAFLVQGAHKSTRVKGKTVCQPFNLTVRRGKENARREALARKIKAEQMKECTFKPKTTEARNRQLINAILADDSLFDDDPEL